MQTAPEIAQGFIRGNWLEMTVEIEMVSAVALPAPFSEIINLFICDKLIKDHLPKKKSIKKNITERSCLAHPNFARASG
jgi:hypothetical protein